MVLQYFILQPMCTIIQIQGHNRARQRDKLGQVLEELSNLQDEVKNQQDTRKYICLLLLQHN